MFLNMKCAKIRVFHRLIFKMWGAKVKSIESNFLQSSVIATDECRLKLQTHLAKRKGVIDFETLGRTLAYSPFLPRFEREFFARARANPPKNAIRFEIQGDFDEVGFLEMASGAEQNGVRNGKHKSDGDMFLLDLRMQYMPCVSGDCVDSKVDSSTLGMALESISLLRRHSTLPIIHADLFVDSYQILESALFGADSLLIPCGLHSAKTLSELLQFARRLNLEPFVEVCDKDELKRAIFSGASMLFIHKDSFETLLSLVPNSQIIATNHHNDYGVDVQILDSGADFSSF
ncbi:putative indole-3-glycerol-phosphate synthase [Helicobacter cinaedi]|uniref:indole-3-glycerol-phosphate synthase n=2 Tax=Helicobacter cinaedi TaxID=213 RepID=A0A377JLY8_9HELI|nr:putative indole-3-glycerol-phosphate synthase [Helicobacter cinaedi]